MQLTEVRINLCPSQQSRLKAFCSLTFDNTFVIRDVKLIEGPEGLFLAMPSRKLCDHCPRCGEKNHLRARFCNGCGARLDDARFMRQQSGNGNSHGRGVASSRLKLHADIAHPINAECRHELEDHVVHAYQQEIERSKQPGYVPPSLESEDMDYYDDSRTMHLRPTGTSH